ncbi:MAG: DUF1573 domain-containing protein [Saprospiraceae bacterium]|nr:DUF1573 domain-containing protein [Saprospiraceae bacterium]
MNKTFYINKKKTMDNCYLFLLCVILFTACNSSEELSTSIPTADEIERMETISNSTLINNPITADEAISPENAAKIEFEEEVFDFGSIIEGEVVEHIFKFKNTGKTPLIINHAKGSCGCTIPEWPHDPISPGVTSKIKVKFNSKGKQGEQNKTVTISANTIPNKTTIRIVGGVEINPETEKKAKENKTLREKNKDL